MHDENELQNDPQEEREDLAAVNHERARIISRAIQAIKSPADFVNITPSQLAPKP